MTRLFVALLVCGCSLPLFLTAAEPPQPGPISWKRHVLDTAFHSEGVVKNILAYGIGLCLSTIYEHRLSHNLIRFPDFLDHPEKLFCALRFPMEVTKEEFLQVFESIVRREFVHDRS